MKVKFSVILLSLIFVASCSTVKAINRNKDLALHDTQKNFSKVEKYWLVFEDPLMNQLADDLLKQNLQSQSPQCLQLREQYKHHLP